MAVAPLVGLVAAPIFAIKSLPMWIQHNALYKKTLTILPGKNAPAREKFGRVPGQDYTRWDGKISPLPISPQEAAKMEQHELINEYVHGLKSYPINVSPDSAFKTKDDLDWLDKEYTRLQKKDLLDGDWKTLRVFAKAIIPIVGVLWIVATETLIGGASQVECPVCTMGGNAEDTHWGWATAIDFHRKDLKGRLSLLPAAAAA